MFKHRTLKILALIVTTNFLLAIPVYFWLSYLDSPVGIVVAVPYLSFYLFQKDVIPGLLEHNGLCGWGWCAPTLFGWFFYYGVLADIGLVAGVAYSCANRQFIRARTTGFPSTATGLGYYSPSPLAKTKEFSCFRN